MKKSIIVLGVLASLVMLVGCASTKASGPVEDNNGLIVPKIGKKLCGDNDANPLTATNVEGIYVIHPYEGNKWTIKNGCQYEIEIEDKITGELYSFKSVVNHWNGMWGWNGQVKQEDLTFITADSIQYVVKENLFTWNILIEGGYAAGGMDNPIIETEVPSIYVIKPGYYKNTKKLIDNGRTYKIQVIDKSTKDIVKIFDNVVDDWQGMTGWNGMVVAEDYTFITKDVKQYVVKGNKYTIKVIR